MFAFGNLVFGAVRLQVTTTSLRKGHEMETETTLTITETINEIIAITNAKDVLQKKYNETIVGNGYLAIVMLHLELSAQHLSSKLANAIEKF